MWCKSTAMQGAQSTSAPGRASWPHSSVRAHLAGRDGGHVKMRPLVDRVPRFADLLEGEADDPAFLALRRSELIGRPPGAAPFVEAIGKRLGRNVMPGKRGRKPLDRGAKKSVKPGAST
jgi:putative transposase